MSLGRRFIQLFSESFEKYEQTFARMARWKTNRGTHTWDETRCDHGVVNILNVTLQNKSRQTNEGHVGDLFCMLSLPHLFKDLKK